MILRAFLLVLVVCTASGLAQAQQYRWVDRNGVTQFGDAPPPGAKNIQKISVATGAKADGPSLPFEIARVQKDFPVTLYTSPNCKELCAQARGVLNKRSVPFTEVQVWNDETVLLVRKAAGTDHIPALVVGRSVLAGFDQGQYDELLSTAGYPPAGTYPARTQGAPAPPEGYVEPGAAPPDKSAKAAQKSAPAQTLGPYDASGLTGPAPTRGQYDPSGLTGPAPKPGQYGIPGEGK